jgi:putative ABC transport system permease protein
MATMLLVGAALLLQSFVQLQRVPPGFEPSGVLTARIGLTRSAYPDEGRTALFYRQLLESLARESGVRSVATGSSVPFASGVRRTLQVSRVPVADRVQSVAEHFVSDRYFETLAIPMLAGRPFDERDRQASPPVVIVSQATARELWPDVNPVGQQLQRDGGRYEVVGVVGDVRGADGRGLRGGGLDRQPRAAIYLSAAQFPQRTMTVLVRTTQAPSAFVSRLRTAVQQIDAAVPLDQARSIDEWLTDTAAGPRLTTVIATAFAAIAVLLAAFGIYGVVAYSVGRRTAEIGLRMAVGATRRNILALVLRGGLRWVALGTAIGVPAAFLVSRTLATVLFAVRPDDPLTFASATTLLAFVALVACYLPARRVARVDPLVALRRE